MSGWWGSKLFLLVWMPAGIEPAGTAFLFHWGCSDAKQLRLEFLHTHNVERVTKQPFRLNDLQLLGMIWRSSCLSKSAPISILPN